MSVTVSEVLIAARSGLAAVSSETAGYLVLGTADCLGDVPFGIASVYLDEDGALRVDRRAESAGGDSEAGLRAVLQRLLETGRSPAPALLRVAGAREKRGVRRLITEIEAALIPVNRAAARRALARLHRDVLRGKTAGKLPAAEELLPLEPSAAPPKAVPVEVRVERAPTEGPTPVVPVVEPIPSVAIHELAELAPVETLEPSPAPWADYVPEATPLLGSLVTAPRELSAVVPMAEVEVDAQDTDRAPPVELDARSDTPRFAAETAFIGTYGASPVAPAVELEIPLEVLEVIEEPEPEVVPEVVPEVQPFEPVFARETAGAVALPVDEEREARDALEEALLDFGDSDDGSPSAEPDAPLRERFVPMFELSPESVRGEQASDVDVDVPPAIDEMPELGALEHLPFVEEPSASMEALIDEALAAAPEVPVAEELPPSLHSAPAVLPRSYALIGESGTAPGLGFINIALVAANIQDVAPPPPARLDEVSVAEPPSIEPAPIEPLVAELPPVEPLVAELPPIEPLVAEAPPIEAAPIEALVAESAPIEPSVSEFAAAEPAIAELEAISGEIESDVFEPAIPEFAVDEPGVFEPAVAELAVDEPGVFEPAVAELAVEEPPVVRFASDEDEPAVDEPVIGEPPVAEFAPDEEELAVDEPVAYVLAAVEHAVEVVRAAVAEFATAEGAIDESAYDESGVVESVPAVIESAAGHHFSAPDVAAPEGECVAVVPASTPSYRPRRSDVADLVAAFVVAESRSLAELSRELKRIAGIGATPAPSEVAPGPVRRKVSSVR
jgi:hypothetical protein